jgi:hypothetical protein
VKNSKLTKSPLAVVAMAALSLLVAGCATTEHVSVHDNKKVLGPLEERDYSRLFRLSQIPAISPYSTGSEMESHLMRLQILGLY